jgi:ribosomal protein S12 methylthiotransferase accessory factor
MSIFRYASSLRVQPIERTLEHARRIAGEVGVVRVTDTTGLDRIGVPVFAAIRPDAEDRSLCVSAGKGLTRAEALVGAYMEAIELAFAEKRRAGVEIVAAGVRDILDGSTRRDAIADFCPDADALFGNGTVVDCAVAADIRTGRSVLVPAEKVVFPHVKALHGARTFFSSDGNGIASGNSLDEATVHGLAEVIERDVTSYHNVSDASELILAGELPAEIAELAERLDAIGFDLWLRHLPNRFGLPTIMAALRERGVAWGIHFGHGCHPHRSIALVRAVTESIQHRLSMIHGGRDDIHRTMEVRAQMSPRSGHDFVDRHAARAASTAHGSVRFGELPDYSQTVTDIPSALALLLDKLAENGLPWALRVKLGPDDLPITLVRVLVPGCELFGHGISNVGPRLRRFMDTAE